MWSHLSSFYASRRNPEGARRIARAYWRVLLCVTAGIVAIGVMYGVEELAAAFAVVSNPASQSPATVPAFDRLRLHAVLDSFDTRTARYQGGGDIATSTPDPSR